MKKAMKPIARMARQEGVGWRELASGGGAASFRIVQKSLRLRGADFC